MVVAARLCQCSAPVKPVIGALTITPTPVAGKHITVTFLAESFTAGTAKLAFTIPKTAKGKQLRVKVTIKLGRQSTTKIATFEVG